jgi:type VI secretion system protein
MREQRLLERLDALERDPLRRARPDRGRLVDSIVAHLRCLLNTRQGSVPIAKDYGVPEFLHFLQRYPDSVREIEWNIRQTIVLYEPRLKAVQVTFLPQEETSLSLHFRIRAQIDEEKNTAVNFETVVENDGRVLIRH